VAFLPQWLFAGFRQKRPENPQIPDLVPKSLCFIFKRLRFFSFSAAAPPLEQLVKYLNG
jgi:hypothetical protein